MELLGQRFEEWPTISLQSLLVSLLFSSLLHHGVTWYVCFESFIHNFCSVNHNFGHNFWSVNVAIMIDVKTQWKVPVIETATRLFTPSTEMNCVLKRNSLCVISLSIAITTTM